MQVEPMKPTLQPPGTKRLKLKYDQLLKFCLHFAFKFKLCRYNEVTLGRDLQQAMVRRCTLTVSEPVLKAKAYDFRQAMVSALEATIC